MIRLRVDNKCDDTFGSIAHEVAHTWFHGSDAADWIDEGLANSIENQMKESNPEAGVLYPPVTYCASYRNIKKLEMSAPTRDASSEASGFSCNYQLGDGIFGALREYFRHQRIQPPYREPGPQVSKRDQGRVHYRGCQRRLWVWMGCLTK